MIGGMTGWLRSSFCGTHGSCLEVRDRGGDMMFMRRRVAGFTLWERGVTREEWDTFVKGVKAGEFDAAEESA